MLTNQSKNQMLCITILIFILFGISPSMAQNASFGMNVGPLNYWSSNAMYIDVLKHAKPWSTPSNGVVATDIDGYPLADCSTIFFVLGYPSGTYSFSMTGSGTPKFGNFAQIIPGTLSTSVSNGVTTTVCQVKVSSPNPVLGAFNGISGSAQLSIKGVNPSNPPKNLHLMMPGYSTNTTQIFNPQFLQALSPFACLRMMDMMHTNGSQVTIWPSRLQPTAWGEYGGSSYEMMIAMCNASNKDIWINVPYLATDDWAVGMAKLLKNNLNSNLNIYLEYSNECWNTAFRDNYSYIQNQAQNNSALPLKDAGAKRLGDQVAYNLVHFAGVFKQALGDASSRLRPVLCGQFGNPIYLSAGLAYIKQSGADPKSVIYGIAGAPYLWPTSNSNLTSLDDVFQSLNDTLNSKITPAMQQNVALANSYGIKFLAYEAGQSLVPTDEKSFQLFESAQQDPRMQAILEKLARIWNTGGDLCNFYSLCGIWNKWGYWGALTDMRQITNPILRYSAEAGIANVYNVNKNKK